ncbi:hypothetical protein DFR87_07780 [Metallosphaera hakonensis JCM 8857 = DSM 7519]|uniref:Uncharacterized protein n=1 Tax=Metallosphaera hakonensis JCM 8857 = DSM 7519 TaxID=1293036 RepID=A0A2U9IXB0_9CREN|nr:hypothetical protein DFR87_07780 [Metallosphaera hakonensis JCM 8857 = DSM 7519]
MNNPLLIVPARFVYSTSSTPWWWDRFAELVIEATGFSPKPLLVGDMPLVSQYALGSLIAMRNLGKRLSLSEDEIWETLELIDSTMFESYVWKGVRYMQRTGTPILYRNLEDPVPVKLGHFFIRKIMSFPISTPRFMDGSLTHLAGLIPVYMADKVTDDLVDAENGLWKILHGLTTPPGNFKWVWDLRWSTLIELLNWGVA